jgi:hypothetical protein
MVLELKPKTRLLIGSSLMEDQFNLIRHYNNGEKGVQALTNQNQQL